MTNYFIVPGLGNSGPEHWQTHFEKSDKKFTRILQQKWVEPVCSEWIDAIDQALSGQDLSTVVLVGHSLGCSAIIHWCNKYGKKIKGAMLVAPSDADAPEYKGKFPALGFSPIPNQHLGFKSILVASEDDPWITMERAQYFADSWGSELINIGKAGHINASAGFGPWAQGLEILKKLGE